MCKEWLVPFFLSLLFLEVLFFFNLIKASPLGAELDAVEKISSGPCDAYAENRR